MNLRLCRAFVTRSLSGTGSHHRDSHSISCSLFQILLRGTGVTSFFRVSLSSALGAEIKQKSVVLWVENRMLKWCLFSQTSCGESKAGCMRCRVQNQRDGRMSACFPVCERAGTGSRGIWGAQAYGMDEGETAMAWHDWWGCSGLHVVLLTLGPL